MLYSPTKVRNALKAIRESGMKLATASTTFGVPRATLWNKLNNKAPETTMHPGRVSVLPHAVEEELVSYILYLSSRGFPLDKESVLDSVKKIVETLKIQTPFADNRPSRKWWESFLRRHPSISFKQAEHLGRARALVTEKTIREWFSSVKMYLEEDGLDINILQDAKRVWNTDETAMFLSPKGRLVLGERGQSLYEVSSASDKDCITTLFTVNASGDMAPALALFPYERLPQQISSNCPDGWGLGTSPRGWMTGETFYEYIGNVFVPYLEEHSVELPVVLFLDGHKSHITKHLSDLCSNKKIILVALPPNATAILQPLDVAVFRPLKMSWLKVVKKWRIDHDGEEVTKYNFCQVVNEAIMSSNLSKAIASGFRATGLCPFNADNVDYSKCVKKTMNTQSTPRPTPELSKSEVSHLDYLESTIDPFVLMEFHESYKFGTVWRGDPAATMLYSVWCTFRKNEMSESLENSSLENSHNDVAGQSGEMSSPDTLTETPVSSRPMPSTSYPPLSDPSPEQFPLSTEVTTQEMPGITLEEITEKNQEETPETNQEETPETNQKETPETNQKETPESSQQEMTANNQQEESAHVGARRSLHDVFQKTLYWPGTSKKKTRRNKEKVPSVITSAAWKEYYTSKSVEKLMMEEEKKKRKEERERKKAEKAATVGKRRPRSSKAAASRPSRRQEDLESSSDSRPDAVELQDSSDDDSIHEHTEATEIMECSPNLLKEGMFVLVNFKSGGRKSITYTYVCVTQSAPTKEADDEKEMLRVMGLKSVRNSKTMFHLQENDVSDISVDQVVGFLPEPKLVMQGGKKQYTFDHPVDAVYEIP